MLVPSPEKVNDPGPSPMPGVNVKLAVAAPSGMALGLPALVKDKAP